MHLLYIDESGSAGDRQQKHFVLAGISIFERQGYWIASELDKIAERINPADPMSVEFHGSPIYGEKNSGDRLKRSSGSKFLKKYLVCLPSQTSQTEFLSAFSIRKKFLPMIRSKCLLSK